MIVRRFNRINMAKYQTLVGETSRCLWRGILFVTFLLVISIRADPTEPTIELVEATEIMTTEVMQIIDDIVEVDVQGQDEIVIRFTIINRTLTHVSEDMEDWVVKQMDSVLQSHLPTFNYTQFKSFSHLNSPRVTTNLKLIFNQPLSTQLKKEAHDYLHELVEVNGAIGDMVVEKLVIENSSGDMVAYTYCDVTDVCPSGMNCRGKGKTCTASCGQNSHYCLHGGTCIKDADFVICNCTERFNGTRCENMIRSILSDEARIALIAVASFLAFILLIILLCCLAKSCRMKRQSTREMYGVENVVALHSLRDETDPVGGIAIQTDDSFLQNLSYANGIPPKSGYSHKIMQTNESFLLTRSQNPKVAHVRAQANLHKGTNSSDVDSREPNGNNNSPPLIVEPAQPNAEQRGSNPPHKIVKV